LFAKADTERFAQTQWHWGVSNQPVLDNTLVSLECRAWAEYDGGDHIIFVGEVLNINAAKGTPAAFFDGRLGAYQP
jgi:flavin reductase (DIM6/NTAB) family NADH-FMN oxidoreductase RutF